MNPDYLKDIPEKVPPCVENLVEALPPIRLSKPLSFWYLLIKRKCHRPKRSRKNWPDIIVTYTEHRGKGVTKFLQEWVGLVTGDKNVE